MNNKSYRMTRVHVVGKTSDLLQGDYGTHNDNMRMCGPMAAGQDQCGPEFFRADTDEAAAPDTAEPTAPDPQPTSPDKDDQSH